MPRYLRSPRLLLGLAAAVLLTACGADPGTPAASPTAEPPAATSSPAPTTSSTATPTTTPDDTATPTASPSATPEDSASPTPATRELPARLDSFTRVDERNEDGVRIGTYRSESLGSVIEVRLATNAPARELITDLGGTSPTQVGEALCSTQGDTICALERDGVTAAVATKQLPASVVADLTAKVLAAP